MPHQIIITLMKSKNTWASLTGLDDNAFRDTLEVCENRDAYEHLLKLTSGLESLVVGEEQILGQIKRINFGGKKGRCIR